MNTSETLKIALNGIPFKAILLVFIFTCVHLFLYFTGFSSFVVYIYIYIYICNIYVSAVHFS